MSASSPFARRQACSARPCKYDRKRLRPAAEFRAVLWQVTKRRLSTTKAAEPAGIGGIKAKKWIQQQRLESIQLSDQTSVAFCCLFHGSGKQLCQVDRGRLTGNEEVRIAYGF